MIHYAYKMSYKGDRPQLMHMEDDRDAFDTLQETEEFIADCWGKGATLPDYGFTIVRRRSYTLIWGRWGFYLEASWCGRWTEVD